MREKALNKMLFAAGEGEPHLQLLGKKEQIT
jgi:hypothetical protein